MLAIILSVYNYNISPALAVHVKLNPDNALLPSDVKVTVMVFDTEVTTPVVVPQ